MAVWDVRSTKPLKVFETDKSRPSRQEGNGEASGWLSDEIFELSGNRVRAPGWSVRNVKFGGSGDKEIMTFTEVRLLLLKSPRPLNLTMMYSTLPFCTLWMHVRLRRSRSSVCRASSQRRRHKTKKRRRRGNPRLNPNHLLLPLPLPLVLPTHGTRAHAQPRMHITSSRHLRTASPPYLAPHSPRAGSPTHTSSRPSGTHSASLTLRPSPSPTRLGVHCASLVLHRLRRRLLLLQLTAAAAVVVVRMSKRKRISLSYPISAIAGFSHTCKLCWGLMGSRRVGRCGGICCTKTRMRGKRSGMKVIMKKKMMMMVIRIQGLRTEITSTRRRGVGFWGRVVGGGGGGGVVAVVGMKWKWTGLSRSVRLVFRRGLLLPALRAPL